MYLVCVFRFTMHYIIAVLTTIDCRISSTTFLDGNVDESTVETVLIAAAEDVDQSGENEINSQEQRCNKEHTFLTFRYHFFTR